MFKIVLVALFLSVNVNASEISHEFKIKSISLMRTEIQLEINRNSVLKVGSKLIGKSAVEHKCLLVITKIQGNTAFADAARCPGYATLKKGQTVELVNDNEVNEEIKLLPKFQYTSV